MILSVPFRNQSETLTNLKRRSTPEQLLIDATVPLAAAVSGKATRTLGVWQGSAAQQAQEMAPEGVRVVSAFHTVSAALLTDLDHELDEDVLVCGDRSAGQGQGRRAGRQIDGLRAVDCGPLEMARIVEQLTPLLISINVRHKMRAGIKITGLLSWIADGPVVVLAGGTGGAKLARGMLDVVGADELVVDRQHRRRHRDLRGLRLPRPGPRHLLAGRPDRRTRLGACTATPSPSWTGCASSGVDVWFNLGDRDLAIGHRARAGARRRARG